jgi:predicted metal-dependent HD superfamily phosphohydrolase
LQQFLLRPRIYQIFPIFEVAESIARKNIQAEIARYNAFSFMKIK